MQTEVLSMHAVRLSGLGIVSTFLLFLIAGFWPGMADSAQAQEKPKNEKINELLKERLATVKKLAEVTQAAYQQGRATIAEVTQANARLLKAELELCQSDKERLVVRERALALAKEYEKVASQLYKSGQATQASVLAARANRLEAEIAYERAKAKMAGAPK
jgi:outer membrane protein TolC